MIYYLGLIGIAAFSITGVIAAGKKDMDIFSIVLLGVVTALDGGTLRDMIIDVSPRCSRIVYSRPKSPRHQQ